MFNINKPAFSNTTNNNSSFFGSTQSRFGDSSFCKPTPSFGEQAFGKPATPNFGASTTGVNTFGGGSSMFGTTSNPFAQPPSAQTSNVFGNALFRNTTQNDMFSASQKPGSFNYTSPQTSAGIFGQPVSPISSQNQNNLFTQPSNVFTSSPTFGSGQKITGTVIKFAAVNVADTAIIKGINQTINCRHQSITCMKEYEDKSFEELRWEDYQSNRKGTQNDYFGNKPNSFGGEPMSMESAANMFPSNNKSYFGSSAFGHNKFGTTASHTSGNPSGIFNKSIAGFTTTPSNPTPFNFNLNQTTNSSFFGNTSTNTPANNFGMQQQQQQQQSNIFNTNQPSNFGTFNQNPSSNLFSKNVNSFTATTATNSFLGMQQTSQQNSLFPGLNSTNTTFSHGNLPATTTPTIGQSSFGQNNIFQSTFNKTNTGVNSLFNKSFIGLSNNAVNTSHNTLGLFNSKFNTNTLSNSINLGTTQPFSFSSLNNSSQINNDPHILSMTSTPYGLPDLLNNIKEIDNNIKNSTKVTNPSELKALLKTISNPYVKSSNERLQPVQVYKNDQRLFNGLEFKDEELLLDMRLNKNPKRLSLRNKPDFNPNLIELRTDGFFKKNITSFDSVLKNINSSDEIVQTETTNLNTIEEDKHETPPNENNDEDNNKNCSYGEVNSKSSNENLNPAGITLTRAEYYTVPPLNEIAEYVSEDGTCIIQGFTIGRIGYGSVFFPDAFDVSNLNLDELVHFRHKEINIYPNESEKPPFGEGLNRKAQITLDNVWPFDKKTKRIIKDIETLTKINYTGRLRRLCEKQHTKFIEYRPDTGSWVFKVEHFSKYGDRDDEADLDDFIPLQNTLSTNLNIITDSNETIETPAANDTDIFGLNIIKTDFSKYSLMKSTFFDENDIDNFKNNNFEESLDEELNILASTIAKKLSEIDFSEQEVSFEDKELPLDIFEDNSGEYVKIADCVELPPGKLSYNRTFLSYFRIVADLSGFKGRSFKVGWAKNFTFVNLTPNDNQIKNYRDHYPSATVFININKINTISNTEIFTNCFEKHLNCELEISQFEIREHIPYFKPKLDFDLLKKQTDICSSFSFEQQIWQLCTTLWMEIPTLDLEKYDLRTIRKSLFSNWLETVISAECSARKTNGLNDIFNCLTENRISEACEIALESDNNNLAVIISQLPSNMILRALFKKQIKQWLDCDMIQFINPIILKLYCLAAGLTKIELKYNLIMSVYENMNWIKTLAIYFWFIIKPNEPLTYAINTYDKQLKHNNNNNNNNNISKPYPKYGNTSKKIYDLRFQILKFYSDNRFSLSNVLNPASYTDNILDYRFSWFLLQIFLSLEYAHISPKIRLFVTINFAAQLEAMGLWHWAVYIISTIEETHLKKMLIEELIGRNVESLKNCNEIYKMKELFLVNTLKIPTDWIDNAKAILTLDQGNFQEAICYLCYSNKWQDAYKILLSILLPYNFLCYDYQFLTKILTPFANHKLLFPNWENEGGLILDFAELGIDVNNLKSMDSVRIQSESIRFRTTVININSRLKDINDFNYIRIIARRNVSILEKLLNC